MNETNLEDVKRQCERWAQSDDGQDRLQCVGLRLAFSTKAARALLVAIDALSSECRNVNSPDLERPYCHDAIKEIQRLFSQP
jgi:hypothetical protein